MDQPATLLDAIASLWKWRKPLIIVTSLAFILSCFLSLLLPNYYKATTTFYAASQDLAKPSPIGNIDKDVDYYGLDTDLDRLFSIANSREIADYLIEKYELYDHYDINPENPKSKYLIGKKFNKLFSTLKTKYDALELSVEDVDPVLSAALANDARRKIHELAQTLIKNSQKIILDAQANSLVEKEAQLGVLNDSLASLRSKYGVYDLVSQGEILMREKATSTSKLKATDAQIKVLEANSILEDSVAYMKAISAGLSALNSQLDKDIEKFNQGYNSIHSLDQERKELSNQMSLDKERRKQLLAIYHSDFPSLLVIEEAAVPAYKHRPRRSLYVLIGTFFAFALCSVTALIIESSKDIEWKQVFK